MAESGIVVPRGRPYLSETIALTVGEDDAVLPALARRARVRIAFAACCPEAVLFRSIARSLQPAGP